MGVPIFSGYAIMSENFASLELLNFSALLVLLGKKSRQFVYDLMRRDATFPRPIKIASDFSIAWRYGEVVRWLDAQPRATLDGLSAVERRKARQATA